jgi:hypothetical protein
MGGCPGCLQEGQEGRLVTLPLLLGGGSRNIYFEVMYVIEMM